MFFEDLTPYAYTQEHLPVDGSSMLNFGWLDSSHEYPSGHVAPAIVECLLRLAARYTNGTRGFHRCPFCAERGQILMLLGDETVYLGSAEIHVTAGDTTYVAPSLVPHYVQVHGYLPPAEVLRALGDACG